MYTLRALMEAHIPVHFNSRPFSCPIPNCVSRFSRRDNMYQVKEREGREREGGIERERKTGSSPKSTASDGGSTFVVLDTL